MVMLNAGHAAKTGMLKLTTGMSGPNYAKPGPKHVVNALLKAILRPAAANVLAVQTGDIVIKPPNGALRILMVNSKRAKPMSR